MNKHKQFIKDCYDGKHLEMCSDWKQHIENKYPEFKEGQFKAGDWVVNLNKSNDYYEGEVCRVEGIMDGRLWCEGKPSGIGDQKRFLNFRKATPEEIEAHLIAEAKKRGFKDGVSFRPSEGMGTSSSIFDTKGISYFTSMDQLCSSSGTVYCDGKWAEIVSKEITKKEAEKLLGEKLGEKITITE